MLALSRSAYDSILDHARADAPLEACGALVGREDGDRDRETANGDDRETAGDVIVDTVRRVPNVAAAPRVTYELDPEATLAVFDEAAATGRDVVGFYHSHPAGPAAMSETDREEASWPGYVYVLASLASRPPILDAWTWTGDEFVREDVVVRDE